LIDTTFQPPFFLLDITVKVTVPEVENGLKLVGIYVCALGMSYSWEEKIFLQISAKVL